jgi:hypothetical protein
MAKRGTGEIDDPRSATALFWYDIAEVEAECLRMEALGATWPATDDAEGVALPVAAGDLD